MKSSKKYLYRRKSKDENFFFFLGNFSKWSKKKQEKFGTVSGKKWNGQRQKLAKDYLWKDKEQKQYIIRPAMKKLEDPQREREKRRRPVGSWP